MSTELLTSSACGTANLAVLLSSLTSLVSATNSLCGTDYMVITLCRSGVFSCVDLGVPLEPSAVSNRLEAGVGSSQKSPVSSVQSSVIELTLSHHAILSLPHRSPTSANPHDATRTCFLYLSSLTRVASQLSFFSFNFHLPIPRTSPFKIN